MNLLITGAWKGYSANVEELHKAGHETFFMQWEKEPLPVRADWVEGIVCGNLFLYHSIENFPNLKYIQVTSAGIDRLPVDYIRKHGITLHNAKGVYSIPIAEYVLGGVLQIYKKFPLFSLRKDNKEWIKDRNLSELFGKKILIVGCGDIGRECAKRFSAFGCHVIGLNRTVTQYDCFHKVYPLNSLDNMLLETDIVVMTIAYNQETRHLLSEKRLSMMKEDAVLVNVSRGGVIDENALVETLAQQRIKGAVLDVFEEEPLPEESPLWSMDNVLITPHNSFAGEGNAKRLDQLIVNSLNQVFRQ